MTWSQIGRLHSVLASGRAFAFVIFAAHADILDHQDLIMATGRWFDNRAKRWKALTRVLWTASSISHDLRSLKFTFADWRLGTRLLAALLLIFRAAIALFFDQALTNLQIVVGFLLIYAAFLRRTSAFVFFAAGLLVNHVDDLVEGAFRKRCWWAEFGIASARRLVAAGTRQDDLQLLIFLADRIRFTFAAANDVPFVATIILILDGNLTRLKIGRLGNLRAFRRALALVVLAALVWVSNHRHLIKIALWHRDVGAEFRVALASNRVAAFALVDDDGSLVLRAHWFLAHGFIAHADPLVAAIGLILDDIFTFSQVSRSGFMLALLFRRADAVVTLTTSLLINHFNRLILLAHWQLLDGALGWEALASGVIAAGTLSDGLEHFIGSAFWRRWACAGANGALLLAASVFRALHLNLSNIEFVVDLDRRAFVLHANALPRLAASAGILGNGDHIRRA